MGRLPRGPRDLRARGRELGRYRARLGGAARRLAVGNEALTAISLPRSWKVYRSQFLQTREKEAPDSQVKRWCVLGFAAI